MVNATPDLHAQRHTTLARISILALTVGVNTARRQMPHNNSIFCILHNIIAVLDVFISRLLTLHFPR